MYCEALEQCPQNDMNINNLLDLFELVGLVRNSCISILVGNILQSNKFSTFLILVSDNGAERAHTHTIHIHTQTHIHR